MSSAIQVAKTATHLPDLVEVQRSSFRWFLEKGLIEELDMLKKDPWNEGWMLKVRMEKPAEFENLLEDADYQKVIDAAE